MYQQWVTGVLTGPTWRDSALALLEARRQGGSLDEISGQTGIALAVLHRWLVALDVYESLEMAVIGDALKPRLDEDEVSEILYALRILPRDARSHAARYLLEHRLPATAADGLIQAIKDCRRLGSREGFTCEPGNALAYQKWRMACCSTLPGDRQRYLREGLELAETADVRALFEQAPDRGALREALEARPDVPMRIVGAGDPWPRLVPYHDGRSEGEGSEGSPHIWHDLPAGRYVAMPGWPEVAGLLRPIAISCTASAIPLSGREPVADDENVLLLVETCCEKPEPGDILVEGRGETIRIGVMGSGWHPQPDTLLGKVALVVRRIDDTGGKVDDDNE